MSDDYIRRYKERVQELRDFLKAHPQMRHHINELVETYRICRQRSHGDVSPDMTQGASFEDMYEHVYGASGCSWCRNRAENLEKQKFSQSAEYLEKIIRDVDSGQWNKEF